MPLRCLTVRLLVAFVTSFSMLHLTLVGSGLVCSSGRTGDAPGGMAMAGTPSRAGHAGSASPAVAATHGHSERAQRNGEHRAPAEERCCQSMSSCGVATVAATRDRAVTPIGMTETPAYSEGMLASVNVAPEPPPPKA
jgi:hypothetical protein